MTLQSGKSQNWVIPFATQKCWMGVALFALNSILIATEWVCTTMVHSLNKTNQTKSTLFEIKSKRSYWCHKNFGIVLKLETPKAQFFWSSTVSCKPHLIKTRALCSLIEILFPGCVIVLHYSTPYMGLDVWFFHSNRCLDSLLEPVTVLLAWLQWKKTISKGHWLIKKKLFHFKQRTV